MSNTTEKKALEQLNINSFKEMPKEKFKEFVALFPQMDPELQIKSLEQFPEFNSSVKEYLSGLRADADNAIKSEERITEKVLDICRAEIDALTEMLKRENLAPEERAEIMRTMLEIQTKIIDESARHRSFVNELHKRTVEARLAGLAIAAVAIGVKVVVPKAL